jgi:hypothetical protein
MAPKAKGNEKIFHKGQIAIRRGYAYHLNRPSGRPPGRAGAQGEVKNDPRSLRLQLDPFWGACRFDTRPRDCSG